MRHILDRKESPARPADGRGPRPTSIRMISENRVVMLKMIKGINESIEAPVDVITAWSSSDFDRALDRAGRSLNCLEEAKAAIHGCDDARLRDGYLKDIEEVEAMIHSFSPFLRSKVHSA